MINLVGLLVSLSWSAGASIPQGVAYPGGCLFVSDADSGFLAVAYGAISTSSMTTAHRWYNPYTDTWVSKQAAPSPARWDLVLAEARYSGSRMLFSIGGSDGDLDGDGYITFFTDCYRYDPGSNSWTSIATLPSDLAAEGQMGKTIRDTIYVFGGHAVNYGSGVQWARTDHYAYIPATNTWVQRASLPEGKAEAAVAKAVNASGDTAIYVFGGAVDFDDSWGTPTYSNSAYYYDPGTDTWNGITSLPGPGRNGLVAATLRNKIYIMGGFNYNTMQDYTRVDVYDPITNTYSTGPDLPRAHDGGAAAGVDLPFDYGPTLLTPLDGDTVEVCGDLSVTMDWDVVGPVKIVYSGEGTVSGITNYTYLLRTDIAESILRYTQDPSFSTYTEVTGITGTQYTATLPNTGWWYWIVRSVDEFGDTSLWSDTFAFFLMDTCATGGSEGETPGKFELRTAGVSGGSGIELVVMSPDARGVQVNVYNPVGELIGSRAFIAQPGSNRFLVPVEKPGAYILVIRGGNSVITRKTILLR